MSGAVFNEDYKIPDRLVGLVIGRGGESIKRLQMESGCKIRIASEPDGSYERSCQLTGSQESIDEAKRMIDDVVRRGLSRQNGQQQSPGEGGNAGGFQQGGQRRYNNNYGQNQNNGGGFRRY